jgi:WD40 repeat protein
MNQRWIKALLIALLSCCTTGFSADDEPVPWHVDDAAVRVPVGISSANALRFLGRTPPDVYLSELKPIEADGLSFVPETTNTPLVRERKDKRNWTPSINGTATYSLKPEYTHFTCWLATGAGTQPLALSFDEGKTFMPMQAGAMREGVDASGLIRAVFDRAMTEEDLIGAAAVHPIPPGAKTITLRYSNTDGQGRPIAISMHYKHAAMRQAGFLTRRPAVASVDFPLPDRDPSTLAPLVYTAAGKRVGCRVLWAQLGEPMVLQFDYSDSEAQYFVYIVDREKAPPPLAWEPKAGVVMESRRAKRYDRSITTVAGFQELWAQTDEVLGRNEVFSIYGVWFPFRPTTGPEPRFRRNSTGNHSYNVPGRKHLTLTRLTGTFHIPYTGQYEFLYSAEEAAHFLIDGQLVSQMNYNEGREVFEEQRRHGLRVMDRYVNTIGHGIFSGSRAFVVDLTKGVHQLDFLIYGASERFKATINMRWPGKREHRPMGVSWGHGGFCVWEPIATARPGATERRQEKLSASFTYRRTTETKHQWATEKNVWPYLADYPALDAYNMFLTAHLSREIKNPVYRWRFDDGSIREAGPEIDQPFHNCPEDIAFNQVTGRVVFHTFLSSGMRTVHLDVLDRVGGTVIASTSGNVHVQARWEHAVSGHDYGRDKDQWWRCLSARQSEFMALPIKELASLYHRAALHRGGGDITKWDRFLSLAKLDEALVEVMVKRVDELIENFPYSRLLDRGKELASPALAEYAAAERLLMTVMDRAPAGSYHWKVAATALAQFLTHSEPERALEILDRMATTAPVVDMREGWKLAPTKRWQFIPAGGIPLPVAHDSLDWSDITLPIKPRPVHGTQGEWLSKDFALPASSKGHELVIEFGMWLNNPDIRIRDTWSGAIWCNGKWVGDLIEDWPDGRVIIPASVLNCAEESDGGKNRLMLLFQSAKLPHLFDQGIDSFGVISPDLKRLAWSDRYTHRIHLRRTENTWWDTNPGELAGHPTRIRSLAFAPDGRHLASGSYDRTIKIWDTDNGKELHTLRGHADAVRVLAFSADGKRLASADEEGSVVRIWNADSGAAMHMLEGHTDVVRSLAWSPDGKLLASGGADKTIKLWDASGGVERRTIECSSSPVIELAFAPDSRRLAAASGKGNRRTVTVWDIANAKALCEISTGIHSPHVPLAFSPDSTSLAMGDRTTGQLVAPVTGKVLLTLQAPTAKTPVVNEGNLSTSERERFNFGAEAVFSPDGRHLAAWRGPKNGPGQYQARIVTIWDAKTGKALHQLGVKQRGWIRPQLTKDGRWVAAPSWAFSNREFQLRGPQKVNKENLQVPMQVYLTKACQKLGVNVAYYEGEDGKELPNFNSTGPTDTRTQREIDLSLRQGNENFGMVFSGFLKVETEGEYLFKWKHDNAQTSFAIAGEKKLRNGADIFLTAGAHPITLTYHQPGKSSQPHLRFTWPSTELPGGEVVAARIRADALLASGKRNEAVKILTRLKPFSWPLPPQEQEYVEQARMRIRRFSRGDARQGAHALPVIDSWLFTHPMLRLDPGFMVSVIEAYANMGDRERAFLLAEQMLKEEMHDGQRRTLILTQVKAKINEGDLPAAGKIYQKLKKLSPQSTEVIEARELIKAAVIKKRR